MFGIKKYDFYLAGPMRGYTELNYPLFNKVAKQLRLQGYKIYNPAEHDINSTLSLDKNVFALCMTRDLDAVVNKCRGIALLPGWESSLGANAEAFTAFVCGKNVVKIWFNQDITKTAFTHIDLSGYKLPYSRSGVSSFDPHKCDVHSFEPQE